MSLVAWGTQEAVVSSARAATRGAPRGYQYYAFDAAGHLDSGIIFLALHIIPITQKSQGCRVWYPLGHDEVQRGLIHLVVVLAHGHFIRFSL